MTQVPAPYISKEGGGGISKSLCSQSDQKLLKSQAELLQLISISIEMQAGIKVEPGREAFHHDIHTQLKPKACFESWFMFSFVARANREPRFLPAITLQPCLAVAGASFWAALIEVGADDPAPAFVSSQSFTLHWWQRRDKHPDDLQQGRTDKETPC